MITDNQIEYYSDSDDCFDNQIEYDSDSDDCFDNTKENTGTDCFITSDMKFINFKLYPHIYRPFYPYLELIQSNDIINIILNYIVKDKTYLGLLSFRKTNSSNRNLVNFYMKSNHKKFKKGKEPMPEPRPMTILEKLEARKQSQLVV